MRAAALAISLTCAAGLAVADPITDPKQVDTPASPTPPAKVEPKAAAAPTPAPEKKKQPAITSRARKVDPKKSDAAKAKKKKPATKTIAKTTAKTSTATSQSDAKKPTKTEKTAPSDRWRFTSPKDYDTSPAWHYSSMSAVDCEAELDKRKISYVKETARGVIQPVRLTGPLRGVLFRTDENDKARATTPYEIADCRLVLALDDFAEVLKSHDIVEVRHYSMYRAPDKAWPADKPGMRHNGALAIDAARFKDSTGKELDVDKHFNGAIDAKTCGPDAGPQPVTADATKLRAILCDTVAQRIFNVALTPNYNKPHHNHFHLEVTVGAKWFLLH